MPGTPDQAYVAALDSAEEYMAAQAALSEALRAGFLSLAQARYSMGADRVSALQIPAHLVAAARVKPAEDGNLQLVLTDPSAPPSLRASPASSSSWEAAATPQPAAGVSPDSGAATAAGDTTACAGTSRGVTDAASHVAGSASIEDRLQQLRLAAQQSDSFVEQLAAKYGCEGSNPVSPGGPRDGGNSGNQGAEDDEYDEVARPGKPLHWFGSLVAPSLRDAEGHFGRALALAVRAANAQCRLRRDAEAWRAAQPVPAALGALHPRVPA